MAAVHDTPGLKYCPEDRYILAHYRVGHGVPFTLDGCRHCEGVWLDRDEWEILNERGLHDDLYEIFTEQWQQQIKEEEYRAREEAHWLRVLGEADYAKVREVKAWLESHPERVWLMEYLKLEQHSSRGTAKV
jgi:Zn-finger nucleic acid-binding protein